MIDVFSLNLALTEFISTPPYNRYSMNEYYNQLYVGTGYVGIMLVIVNRQIIQHFHGCGGQSTLLN